MTPLFDGVADLPQLRPYQIAAIEGVRESMRNGCSRVILSSPTGSGKTLTAAEIIRSAVAKGKKVAFVANRIHLVTQTAKVLAGYGIECGIIQGGNTSNPWRSVLVCSVQTIARRGMPEVELIVVDECHGAAGTKAYHEIMLGKNVIGLTATPYSKGLGKHYKALGGPLFEDVVTAACITDLIRDGYLVSAEVWAPSEPDLAKVKVVAGEYDPNQLAEAVDQPQLIGDIVTHWLKLAKGKPTVCFATNISHSKHICAEFNASGIKAEHLDCYTSDEDRVAILGRVASRETLVICNVGILCEGWDFPACECLILARPTKSLIRYIQMAGRILRPFPGKKAIILDHSGVVRRLGFPWDDFSQDLDDGKPNKSKKDKPKEEALPKPCPSCSFMRPPRVSECPACGFKPTPKSKTSHADGDLEQLTGIARNPTGVVVKNMPKQTVYSELLGYASIKGFSEGWAAHKYKSLFGVWPNRLEKTQEAPSNEISRWVHVEYLRWKKEKKTA